MQPLSLWEMLWQLGIFSCVVAPILVIEGLIIFAIFKPIEAIDKL
jgi:hypothetical protein